ncbi:hypothetical protein D3C81_1537780 [compost metagenome]
MSFVFLSDELFQYLLYPFQPWGIRRNIRRSEPKVKWPALSHGDPFWLTDENHDFRFQSPTVKVVDVVAAADHHVTLPEHAALFVHTDPNRSGYDINKLDLGMKMGIKRDVGALIDVHRKLRIQFPILIERFHVAHSASLR